MLVSSAVVEDAVEPAPSDRDHRVMVADDLPILYTNQGCPWCQEAVEYLDGHGVGYRLREVTHDLSVWEELRQKSGQTMAPTLDWHGTILADFGVDELVPFLRAQNVQLEDS